MKCKLCGKATQSGTKNKAHSWVHSQHCGYCHYLGQRLAYNNLAEYQKKKNMVYAEKKGKMNNGL